MLSPREPDCRFVPGSVRLYQLGHHPQGHSGCAGGLYEAPEDTSLEKAFLQDQLPHPAPTTGGPDPYPRFRHKLIHILPFEGLIGRADGRGE